MADNGVYEDAVPIVHPVLLEKWNQKFDFVDLDRNGIHTLSSYEAVTKLFVDAAGLTPEKRADASKIGSDFSNYFKLASDDTLTRSEYIMQIKKLYDNGTLTDALSAMARRVFHCLDVDGDDVISYKEYALFSEGVGRAGAKYMDTTFNAIDTNHDGLLSRDEWVAAYMSYWLDPTVEMKDLPMFGMPDNVEASK